MDIESIRTDLSSPEVDTRLKAITALWDYGSEVAVPLLIEKLRDPNFIVRSFIAMALGKQQTDDSFAALTYLLEQEGDYSVRAEAANALSLFGALAVPKLVTAFGADDHWLVRRSILAALIEMQFPEALFEVCLKALEDEDPTVPEAGIDALGVLANTSRNAEALEQLLKLVPDPNWRMRYRTALALRRYSDERAKAALDYLAKDDHPRVVAAALGEILGAY